MAERIGFLQTIARAFLGSPEDFQTRESEFPSFEEQLAAIRRGQNAARPWRQSSVNEALGVPSILSAVSLISGTVGSLSMEAFRQGSLLVDPNQIPRLIVRPNPKSTPREFWMKTAFYHATRGEFWWWVAHRDIDGNPDALYPVPPWEIMVEANDADRTRPTIRWNNKVMRNEDMRQQMYLPGPDGLRGIGPLQAAGAAVSVTVEANNWAANFFAGNLPSFIGKTTLDLDGEDLQALDAQWSEKPGNLPRWVTGDMEITPFPVDAEKSQVNESRSFQVGETARMFGIPGPLLEYQMSGQSLTYRNEADIWTDFQRRCLSPQYLEPIEQEMSDLLTRSTIGRFNLDQLLRADIKTRYEVYKIGTDARIFGPEYPQQIEGIRPGSVDFAPVPLAPPQADPGAIPMQMRELGPAKCSNCKKHLADTAGPGWSTTCPRCKTLNSIPLEMQMREASPASQFADSMSRTADALMMLATREQPVPTVTVHSAPITVEAAPAPNVTFPEGFVRVEAPPPAEVNVTTPEVHVDAPDMSGVAGAIAAIAERPQPDIHVDAPITVEPAQVNVTVPGPTSKRIERDEDGHLIRIVEEPA